MPSYLIQCNPGMGATWTQIATPSATIALYFVPTSLVFLSKCPGWNKISFIIIICSDTHFVSRHTVMFISASYRMLCKRLKNSTTSYSTGHLANCRAYVNQKRGPWQTSREAGQGVCRVNSILKPMIHIFWPHSYASYYNYPYFIFYYFFRDSTEAEAYHGVFSEQKFGNSTNLI